MIAGHDIVCFSSIDFDYLWQVHQEVMTRLALAGNRVTFVENTGLRRPALADVPRLMKRARAVGGFTRSPQYRAPGLTVVPPPVLPLPYSRLAGMVNRPLLRRAVERQLSAERGRPIVWTFLPTPLVQAVARDLHPALLIYYCVDNLPASSPAARRVGPWEETLFRTADLVFVTSEALRRKALAHRSEAHVFPAGVDAERLDGVRMGDRAKPADLAEIRGPIVGYSGGMPPWVDVGLIAQVARALPHVQVVLVGPSRSDVPSLAGLPNIHVLGPKSRDELPHYLKGFDVGIIPYVVDEYTEAIYPAKLNEYLAFGLPVVSTPLAELRGFNAAHGSVVTLATAQEFPAALGTALALAGDGMAAAARRAVAQSNGWTARMDGMTRVIERALADGPTRNR